ncbi:MAG: DUF885 domain-containing protein [Saprospiraceae bacterium]|nr:DUF885 domain-containing protein [Saprospiraceae bacterium]
MNIKGSPLLIIVCFLVFQSAWSQDSTSVKQVLYEIFEKLSEHHRDYGDQQFRDVSEEAQSAEADYLLGLLNELKQIDVSKLENSDRINFEVFKYELENDYDVIRQKLYLIPFNAEGGFYNQLSYAIRDQYPDLRGYQRYNDRLRAYPAFFRSNIKLMEKGLQTGVVAPRITAENYRVLIEPFMIPEIEQNLFYKPYLKRPDKIQSDSFEILRADIQEIIRDSILPLYHSFDEFMTSSYLPNCRDKVGISEIPGGREIYKQRIAYFTSLDMSPDDVFNRGQEEVKRIRSEMEAILKEVGFKGDFSQFLDFLRTDPQFYVTEPKDLLMHASYIAKRIDGLLPQYFNTLPRLSYGVQPVPEAIAPNYTGGRYSGGSWDSHRAGNYWVNTYKLESRPLYVLPALTLHEAVPGHHLQISLSQEMEGLPRFRTHTYISAFGEGWGLYSEYLGKEMGIYETPYEDFGRLTYEMWRACRLVVDVGMHYKGWSKEQAFEFLSSNTALSLHECNTEINRYIGWPGQAVSYKIGELTIRDLRKRCEQELGDKFDLRKFHDKVLENGSIPLYVLTSVIEEFIKDEKGNRIEEP